MANQMTKIIMDGKSSLSFIFLLIPVALIIFPTFSITDSIFLIKYQLLQTVELETNLRHFQNQLYLFH